MLNKQSKLLHLEKLGLEFNPFPVVPDAQNYFNTDKMYKAIYEIMHCIDARKGFILISGDVGLGKSTLSQLLLLKLAKKEINTALVLNSFLQSGSLLKAINKDFNIKVDSINIEDQLDALNEFLLEQYSQNKNCVIVIDDAQQLNIESLELIRQLSNLETNQNKLVQIILVAQGEIIDTLNRTDLRQLKSRIALNVEIKPLALHEVHSYIEFRLFRAGSSGEIIVADIAIKQLHKLTNGRPRLINMVMDRCLYVVAAYGKNTIDKKLIKQAFDEISLEPNKEKKSNTSLKIIASSFIIISMIGILLWGNNYIFDKAILLFNNTAEVNPLEAVVSKGTQEQSLVDSGLSQKAKHDNEQNNAKDIESVRTTNTSEMLVLVTNPDKPERDALEFLQLFNLEELESNFKKAIENNSFEELNIQLSKKSDYKLLVSSEKIVNTSLRNQKNNDENYSIWNLNNEKNDEYKWLTFWKPSIELEAFYQGYYSKSISTLQTSLKDIGFYKFNVDGIVGDRTIKAITNLQSFLGRNPSGFPDEITLYQLQYFEELKLEKESIEGLKKLKIDDKPEWYAVDNSIITEKSINK